MVPYMEELSCAKMELTAVRNKISVSWETVEMLGGFMNNQAYWVRGAPWLGGRKNTYTKDMKCPLAAKGTTL